MRKTSGATTPMAILAPVVRPPEELPAVEAAAEVAEVEVEKAEVGPMVTVFTGRSEAFQLIWIMGAKSETSDMVTAETVVKGMVQNAKPPLVPDSHVTAEYVADVAIDTHVCQLYCCWLKQE